MTTHTHGGSRPATRPDDGRHGNSHGSPGRQPKKITLQLGDVHYTHVRTADGTQTGPTMLLEVTKLDRDCVELADQRTGNVYHIVR